MEYSFVVEAKISMSVTVEADSLEEAVASAQARGVQTLCFQCAGYKGEAWKTSGELDCDPASFSVVDAYCGSKSVDLDEVDKLW